MNYNPHTRPFLKKSETPGGLDKVVGLSCPVCGADMVCMVLDDFKEHPDGSATCSCPKCRSPLKQNQEGFVFLNSPPI